MTMKMNTPFRKVIYLFIIIVFIFSCSENDDQRAETRKYLGEPDELIINDYSSFRERLEQLMDDKALREKIGAKARESISKFSIAEIGEQFYKFILPE